MKILVRNATKSYTLDNYEKGEDPSTTQYVDMLIDGLVFNSIDELASELCLPDNKENWYAFDDGRLICSVLEDADGMEASERELEDFKENKINLYAAQYDFAVEFIETFTPTMKEIAKKLEIESYN